MMIFFIKKIENILTFQGYPDSKKIKVLFIVDYTYPAVNINHILNGFDIKHSIASG